MTPLREAVRAADILGATLGQGGDEDAYVNALARAEDHDAWDADRRAEVAAERLRVAPARPPIAELTRCPADSSAELRWLPS